MAICPSNTMVGAGTAFPNYAGRSDVDAELTKELEDAGIVAESHEFMIDRDREVKTAVHGQIPGTGWSFDRAWYYWVATGPGVPPTYAEELNKTHGKVVRVKGDAGGASVRELLKGFAVGTYHIDTAEGLKALADTIKQVYVDAQKPSQPDELSAQLIYALNSMVVATDTSIVLPEGHPGHEAYLAVVARPRALAALEAVRKRYGETTYKG